MRSCVSSRALPDYFCSRCRGINTTMLILCILVLLGSVSFSSACNGVPVTINAIYGNISSPNYPSNYGNNEDCQWIITVPVGFRVHIYFDDPFVIEGNSICRYDFVELRQNGFDNSSSLIGKYCGHNKPPNATSDGRSIYVRFKSDNSVITKGFRAWFNAVPLAGCNGVPLNIAALAGNITSPNYPRDYGNNADCQWIITAPAGFHVQLTFGDSFEIESNNVCRYDFVELRNGRSATSPLIGKYCGYTKPPTATSNGRSMYVRFKSDGSVIKKGFIALFVSAPTPSNQPAVTTQLPLPQTTLGPQPTAQTQIPLPQTTLGPQPAGCNGVPLNIGELMTRTITSPNYPSNYGNRANCQWIITAPAGKHVQITFGDSFAIEYNSVCRYDFVELRNGRSATSPLIGKYCGNTKPPTATSNGRSMYVRFKSDSSQVRKGFTALLISVTAPSNQPPVGSTQPPTTMATMATTAPSPLPPACTGSGLDIVSTNGTFTSPNYPNNYGNNANCEWRIRVPTGFVVLLKFDTFKLESGQNCRYDAVELRNTPISLIGSYCGAKGPFSIMSSGETLFVKFRSDSSQTRKGFSASFTAIIPPTNPPPGLCGVRPNTRIVGGAPATPGGWPWQAMLRTNGGYQFCGGTLITPQWVVTATHCVVGKSPSGLKVRLGAHEKYNDNGFEQDIDVIKIITHPQYHSPVRYANDIALLKLSRPARLGQRVNLACLGQNKNSSLVGKRCFITGWGRLSSGGASPTSLMQASVPVISRARCEIAYRGRLHDSMVCAGFDQGGIDTCQGDSGGPMVCEDNGKWWLEGVTSWGDGCAAPGKFGVYADVRYFNHWLLQKMAIN